MVTELCSSWLELLLVAALVVYLVNTGAAIAAVGHGTSDTTKQEESDARQIREAMAYRVKYRRPGKMRLHNRFLRVHFDNRQGVYPNKNRMLSLSKDLCVSGWHLPEADDEGVAVEDIPKAKLEELAKQTPRSRCADRKSWNAMSVMKQDVIHQCFDNESTFPYGLLAHNHIMLIVLLWMHGAQIPVPEGGVMEHFITGPDLQCSRCPWPC